MKNLLLLIFLPVLAFSQDSNLTHNIEWKTDLHSETNGLGYSFLNTILYGGHITDPVKNNWINSGKKDNIINSELSNTLCYTLTFNKNKIGFSIADRNLINAQFNDDALRMVFQGNFNYQNQTLNFGNSNIRADRFQQYKITYNTLLKKLNITGEFSYLKGNHHLSYFINKGRLYTSSFGTHLDLNYEMDAFVSDTSKLNPFASNGNGLAIGVSTKFTIKNHHINFFLTDLGFIMWNPTATTLAIDSSFNFSGIEVDNILNFNDSVLDTYKQEDAMLSEQNSFKSYIPANIGFSISKAINYSVFKKITAGIHAKWQAYKDDTPLSISKIVQGIKESNYAPLYYLKAEIPLNSFNIFSTLSHGGYTNNLNFDFAFSYGNKVNYYIGTQHLEDLVLAKEATSLSIYFKLKTQF